MPQPDPKHQMRYRFHGENPPKRVVNELPTGPITDGVATMRLYDPIDSWGGDWGVSAKEFATALDQMPKDVHTIQLHVNSPGGEVFDGIAILNALRNHPANIVAVVDGIAASAASFIACGADELVMGKNAELMIHDARGITIGNSADMQSMADLLNHLSDNIAEIYAAKSGGTVADWRTAMLAESWFSADEAVAAGLADRVEGDGKATNAFDLSGFRYQGRAQAPVPNLGESSQTDGMTATPHVYADPTGNGTCDVCGMAEAAVQHEEIPAARTAETTRLHHRMLARQHGLQV